MGLQGTALERGAVHAGVTLDVARRDPVANIRAAAAVLDALAGDAAIDRSGPEEWFKLIAPYSGIEPSDGQAAYRREVDRALGAASPDLASSAAPAPTACQPPPGSGGAPDYAAGVWRPSPNFNARPTDSTGRTHVLIIHTCESNYVSCWSWLVNPASQASAHYVVSEDGNEISQLVHERDRAWHIAATYDCTLNRGHDCWLNGVQSNDFTVGIEHAGFASQASFPASQLEASAALACDVTRDRGIPRDWQHIVGHGQLQPANRTDPGPHWPWIPYLHRVQALCGEIVVDDSAAFNDPAVAAAAVPAAWTASDSTPRYYGGGGRPGAVRPPPTPRAGLSLPLRPAPPPHPPRGSALPFVALLAAIALLPLVAPRWWHPNHNKTILAVAVSLPVLWHLGIALGDPGRAVLAEKLHEYVGFIVVIGALFVISGGIHVQGSLSGTPLVNTGMLGLGAVLADLLGTTGASVLLIRPVLRANQSRRRTVHIVVFFIFLVANCGGLLTPIGDPPLLLGFLKGVPFEWTLRLWPQWLTATGALLVVFNVWDQWALDREERERPGSQLERVMMHEPLRVDGAGSLAALGGGVLTVIPAARAAVAGRASAAGRQGG